MKKPSTLDPFSTYNQKHSSSKIHRKKKSEDIPKSHAEKTENEKRADEDYEMLVKSKKILEAKTKLYDKMTHSGGSLNSDDTCLVQFNKKKQDDRSTDRLDSSESDSDHNSEANYSDPDDDKWTEYTDCLGRTRKCLKEDVDFFKKRDHELSEIANSQINHTDEKESASTKWFVDTTGISSVNLPLCNAKADDDSMSMASKTSKMEEMRYQWENKELDNLNRDKIHYQDVLFDEARTHGVGYYSFSTDADERVKQQKKLEDDREKTLNEQRKREQIRLAREEIVKKRVFAAKNRQRARNGLPPLPWEEFNAEEHESDDSKQVEETKEERKHRKKVKKEMKKKEKYEKEREEKRLHHLRPWDQGKDNATQHMPLSDEEKWEYKPEKPEPMSQEQWNDVKRNERILEFAPPVSFNRFTTIKPNKLKRRNENTYGNMFNEPIQNELDGNAFPVEQDDTDKRRRTEIPPPTTFDYYGPCMSSKPTSKTIKPDITESIEAGLKFLREKSDKTGTGTKQSWVANTTYDE